MAFLIALLLNALAQQECQFPNLSIHDYIVTSEKQLRNLMNKHPVMFLGFSASWCQYCCKAETLLAQVKEKLSYDDDIPLIRIDYASNSWVSNYVKDVDLLPQIYGIKNKKFYRFQDKQTPDHVFNFFQRLKNPMIELKSKQEIEEFIKPPEHDENWLKVIVYILDDDREEDSLYANYQQTCHDLVNWINTETAVVAIPKLVKELKKQNFILHFETVQIYKKDQDMKEIDLALDYNVDQVIKVNGVSLIDELTPYNFPIYKYTNLPILIMFINPNDIKSDFHLNILSKVAQKFEDQVKFGWVDGTQQINVQRKKALGLNTDKLPAAAFNLLENRVLPFDEKTEITVDTLHQFVQDYLQGKFNENPNQVVPSYDALIEAAFQDTQNVTLEEFNELAFVEGYDVAVLVYASQNYEKTMEIAHEFNKLSKRFTELEYQSIKIYRLDASRGGIPKHLKVETIPALYLIPAFHKKPPFIFYEGVGRVYEMMVFIEKYVDVYIELPENPHLTAEEIIAYRKQMEAEGKTSEL